MKLLNKRIISLLMTVTLFFSTASVANAASPSDSDNDVNDYNLMSLDEAGLSRDEVISLFGLTEEEAADLDFYALAPNIDMPKSTDSNVQIEAGGAYQFPEFSFTGSHTGNTSWTVHGRFFLWGVVLKSISDPNATVTCKVIRNDNNAEVGNSLTVSQTNDTAQSGAIYPSNVGTNCFRFTYRTVPGITARLVMIVVVSDLTK